MKKILFIISAILCIILTACGNDSSIGIIGGADGPTSIIVAEKGEKARIITSYTPIAMTRKTRMCIWSLFVMMTAH